MPRLEYFFDYVSPFSYLADSQLPALLERTGAELVYRPFLLGGVMKSSGNAPPFTVPNKGRYVGNDVNRWAARYGLEMAPNSHFPVNTVLAMRAAVALLDAGDAQAFRAYHQAAFGAMWNEGANLADEAVLRDLLTKAGSDGDAVIARCAEPEVKNALRANTDEAVERGAFGAPSFFVREELFFGNDRLDFVEEALRS
jgi:2-hydroxychromene-2-carboxylate isomerase